MARDALAIQIAPLKPAHAYTLKVRALNGAGPGPFSDPLTVYTDMMGLPQVGLYLSGDCALGYAMLTAYFSQAHLMFVVACFQVPNPPRIEGSPDCESIALEIASQHPSDDCHKADALSVELRQAMSSEWENVPSSKGGADRVSHSVIVRALSPVTVYHFRTVAETSSGLRSVSYETVPRMVASFFDALKEPPTVVATSSTGYSITWGAPRSPCQVKYGLRWDLLYSRVEDADAFHLGKPIKYTHTHTPAARAPPPMSTAHLRPRSQSSKLNHQKSCNDLTIPITRCSRHLVWHAAASNIETSSHVLSGLRCLAGCVFKARPHGIAGFEGFSRSSTPASTIALPDVPQSGIRVEVRLRDTTEGWSRMGQELDLAIRSVLGKSLSKLTVVEQRPSPTSTYIVLDLEGINPSLLVRSLAASIESGRCTMPEGLGVLDARFGTVQIIPGSDQTTRISPGDGGTEDKPRYVVALKASLVAAAAFLACYLRASMVRGGRSANGAISFSPEVWIGGYNRMEMRGSKHSNEQHSSRQPAQADHHEAHVSLLGTCDDEALGTVDDETHHSEHVADISQHYMSNIDGAIQCQVVASSDGACRFRL